MKSNLVTLTLKRALAKIKAGWTRGAFNRNRNGKKCYCALGALIAVRSESNTYARARNFLSATLPGGAIGITSYNDAKDRKKSEVIAWFTRAIAASR